METLLYIGKVSLYWVLFYACYQLFLRQQTFFVWNRLYLVGALLVSFALPFVIYPESAPDIPVMYEVSAAAFSVDYVQPEQESVFTWVNAFMLFYLLVVLHRFYTMFGNFRQLHGFIRDGELVELEDCKVVLINSNDIGSFSFLKWIVVNRNDYENHFDAILRHEMVHTSQGHSFDILFVEILRSIFWFNPILNWYKNSLQEVHEYLADEAAPNREHYASFLVSYALNAPIAALTNHFFKPSQLKSRIEMIYKNRSPKWLRSSYLLTFGFIGAVALLIAGCEKIKNNLTETSSALPARETDSTKTITVEGWITNATDKMAIPGASIIVEGLARGTTTDRDGKFTIKAPSHSRLIISFIGFKTQLRPLNGISSHVITLSPSSNEDIGTTQEKEEVEPPARVDEVKIQTLELPGEGKIYTVVEKQPQFPGGVKAMYQFLADNIRYPEAAAEANVTGKVFLSFVVTAKGDIQDVMILKGIGFGCDAEAVRVVSAFPNWEPGTQDGMPVNVKYNLPIMFSLKSEDGLGKSPSSAKPDLRLKASYASNIKQGFFKNPIMPSIINLKGTNFTFGESSPLIFIDGVKQKERGKDGLNLLKPENIESITVLKGETALAAASGDEGKEGVILVKTKKK